MQCGQRTPHACGSLHWGNVVSARILGEWPCEVSFQDGIGLVGEVKAFEHLVVVGDGPTTCDCSLFEHNGTCRHSVKVAELWDKFLADTYGIVTTKRYGRPHKRFDDPSEPVKSCRTCSVTKPLSAFYKHPASKDGRQTQCKECVKAYERARYVDSTRLQLPSNPPTWQEAFSTDPTYVIAILTEARKSLRRKATWRAKRESLGADL
ncbi:SWIM zinc finger family protein [Lentzea terrae]|uniref:SWIM zinc finger family protein n=1 Tax=Lentzea terrae TaxID=2200761 RepID=UPI0038CC0BDF